MNNKQSSIEFLGTGSAHAHNMGNSCAVFELDACQLVIDFGFTAFQSFKKRFQKNPSAIFISHGHLDHIGGLENLFFDCYFSQKKPIKLFIPYKLTALIHERMASMEHMLAEGNANFWDAFQLIPVGETFWYKGLKFNVFENRHHYPTFSYGIALRGHFLFSGDTKPIPEIINNLASQGETIFHDLSLFEQPSHTFLTELTQYTDNILSRCIFYHLSSYEDVIACRKKGLTVVDSNQKIILNSAHNNPQGASL